MVWTFDFGLDPVAGGFLEVEGLATYFPTSRQWN